MTREQLRAVRRRFNDKTVFSVKSHCLIWTSAVAVNGVPLFWYDRTTHDARRFAVALQRGFIDAGEIATPRCGHKLCVNFAHLTLEYHTRIRGGKLTPRKIVFDELKYALYMR